MERLGVEAGIVKEISSLDNGATKIEVNLRGTQVFIVTLVEPHSGVRKQHGVGFILVSITKDGADPKKGLLLASDYHRLSHKPAELEAYYKVFSAPLSP